jgi:hypothetical protein
LKKGVEMMTLMEIEDAIGKLPQEDARKLFDWLMEYLDDD